VKIRWTGPAIGDLTTLRRYIAEHNPSAATRMAARIKKATSRLAEHPMIGRPGRVPGTRELVIRPYIAAYKVDGQEVAILRVIHHARVWPAQF